MRVWETSVRTSSAHGRCSPSGHRGSPGVTDGEPGSGEKAGAGGGVSGPRVVHSWSAVFRPAASGSDSGSTERPGGRIMESHRVDIQAGGDVRARQVAGRDITTVKRRTVKIGLAGWLPSSV